MSTGCSGDATNLKLRQTASLAIRVRLPDSCRSRMTEPGRVPVATNGCFADTEPERGRSRRRAALAKLVGQQWVGSDLSNQHAAVVQPGTGDVWCSSGRTTPRLRFRRRLCQLYCLQRALAVTGNLRPNVSNVAETVRSRAAGHRPQPLHTGFRHIVTWLAADVRILRTTCWIKARPANSAI